MPKLIEVDTCQGPLQIHVSQVDYMDLKKPRQPDGGVNIHLKDGQVIELDSRYTIELLMAEFDA